LSPQILLFTGVWSTWAIKVIIHLHLVSKCETVPPFCHLSSCHCAELETEETYLYFILSGIWYPLVRLCFCFCLWVLMFWHIFIFVHISYSVDIYFVNCLTCSFFFGNDYFYNIPFNILYNWKYFIFFCWINHWFFLLNLTNFQINKFKHLFNHCH
jgi:hypothetical protein